MIGETVTIHHPSGGGNIGTDGEASVATYTPVAVAGCAVAPGNTTENNALQVTVEVAFTIYLPPGSVVESDARMVVRGDTFEVVGQPEVWVNPFDGTHKGVVATVTRSR